MYTLKYHIPKTPHQRESKQTLKNLTKQDLQDWLSFLENRKTNATYKIV